VLAAGMGERLRPLTLEKPKPLLLVGGRPLIHYALMMLRQAGVTEVVINLHYMGEAIRAALGDGTAFGIKITYAPEPKLLNTGGPLVALKDFFAGETFWVVNSDSILDFDLRAMVDFHRRNRALATLALTEEPANRRYSRIEVDRQGRVRRIHLLTREAVLAESREFRCEDVSAQPGTESDARAGNGEAREELLPRMFCGLSLCESGLIRYAPQREAFGLVSHLLAPLVARGEAIYGYTFNGFFRTVDDLESYEALKEEFAYDPPQLSYLKQD